MVFFSHHWEKKAFSSQGLRKTKDLFSKHLMGAHATSVRCSEQIDMISLPGAHGLDFGYRADASLLLWSWEHSLERLWTLAQNPGLSASRNLQHMVSSLPHLYSTQLWFLSLHSTHSACLLRGNPE